MVVIRFSHPRGIDFPSLLSMIHDSFMSRPNTIVVPGGKMDLAMQLIFTPMILRLVEIARKHRAACPRAWRTTCAPGASILFKGAGFGDNFRFSDLPPPPSGSL